MFGSWGVVGLGCSVVSFRERWAGVEGGGYFSVFIVFGFCGVFLVFYIKWFEFIEYFIVLVFW